MPKTHKKGKLSMKKRIITIIGILLIVLVGCTLCCSTIVEGEQEYTKEQLTQLIEEQQSTKYHSSTMASSARELGWNDEDSLIKQLQDKWWNADDNEKTYQAMLDEILTKEEEAARAEEAKWASRVSEYPAATTIWRACKAQGWNDYVCAGIMGNLMAEVGGQTLNIKWNTTGNGYYGMCQWNKAYSAVWGKDLEGQIDFLINTIKYEFDTYGSKYAKGFNFNSFLNLQDCRAAAEAFRACYERSSTASREVRKNNATKAYNYFVN